MKVIDALLGEHGMIYVLLDKIDSIVSSSASLNDIQCASGFLSSVIGAHSKLEDALLDPALAPHLGKTGPIAEMRVEHDDIRSLLQQLESIEEVSEGVDLISRLLQLIRNHFLKEEMVLFAIAQQVLGEQTQIQLGTAWAKERGISIAEA